MSTQKTYRYQLQPYSGKNSRFTCPSCNRKYQLTRYVDTVSGNYISPIVGICNHRNSCGYHYTPRLYFAENGYDKNESFISGPVINKPVAKSIDYITYPCFVPNLGDSLHNQPNKAGLLSQKLGLSCNDHTSLGLRSHHKPDLWLQGTGSSPIYLLQIPIDTNQI